MKRIIYFFIIVLLLNVVFACNNDSLLDQNFAASSQNIIAEKNDTVQTFDYCYGCSPMISAFHDSEFNQFVIAWSGYTEEPSSHPITISYKVAGTSGSLEIRSANGEIRKNIYSESYIASWNLRCGNSDCLSCGKSGSLSKKASGGIENGSETECYKELLSYSIEKVNNYSNMFDLVLNDYNGNLYNTEKYMTVDRVRAYKIDSYSGREVEISGATSLDMSFAPQRLRLTLHNQNMHQNFVVYFYSSKCSQDRHSYFIRYYFDNWGAQLSGSSLTLIRNH